MKEAFEVFCNKTVDGCSSPEQLASFCDNILKKGGSEKLSDEVIEETLDKVVFNCFCKSKYILEFSILCLRLPIFNFCRWLRCLHMLVTRTFLLNFTGKIEFLKLVFSSFVFISESIQSINELIRVSRYHSRSNRISMIHSF